MVPASSVLGKSTHLENQSWNNANPVQKVSRRPFRISYEFKKNQNAPRPSRLLGAFAAGKAPKVVLIGREGRGREAVSTCSAGGQSKTVANSAKNAMCLVYLGSR